MEKWLKTICFLFTAFSSGIAENLHRTLGPINRNVRLVNGSRSYAGRVEVYSYRQWHTVCGRSWGFFEADMVCKELGYDFAIHPSDYYNFGPGSADMLSFPVVCKGSEARLDECHYKYDEFCSHSSDVGVVCSQEPLEEGSVRLLNSIGSYKEHFCGDVQVYLDDKWGGICDKRYTWNSNAADVACKQMGFDGSVDASHAEVYKCDGKQVIGSLYCTGQEAKLIDCYHDRDISECSKQPYSDPSISEIGGVKLCCYHENELPPAPEFYSFWYALGASFVIVCLLWLCKARPCGGGSSQVWPGAVVVADQTALQLMTVTKSVSAGHSWFGQFTYKTEMTMRRGN